MRLSRRWTFGLLAVGALVGIGGATRQRASLAIPGAERRSAPTELPLVGQDSLPNGQAPVLSCHQARAVVAQAREQIVSAPKPIDAPAFARYLGDWLDPYGLWSAAPDAPIQGVVDRLAGDLVHELEADGATQCASFAQVGAELKRWVDGLAVEFERAGGSADGGSPALFASIFEGETVTRPARELTQTLAVHAKVLRSSMGPQADALIVTAAGRYFPNLTIATWQRATLSAAVRAYVQSLDPHGAWSPREEEGTLHESDLAAAPPAKLWDRITATSYGFRIVSGAVSPFLDGDVIVSLAGAVTGGLPLEQAEQLGSVAASARAAVSAKVWRDDGLVVLQVPPSLGPIAAPPPDLDVERIRYGNGDVLLVGIHDVREDLGQSLTAALLKARSERSFLGVVLDLRGNGGGDPDGASDALGLFMPGVPLFPMRRRAASVVPDRAAVPPLLDQWRGPLATLVDAETASAAEMIAGALMAYGRAPSIGEHTFGKGCVQEYFADVAGAGAMRLTTMVFALPDGAPLQKVGIEPTLPFAFGSAPVDNEAQLGRAPESWSGSDVRAPQSVKSPRTAWPRSGGRVGPCSDDRVCAALALLSSEGKRVATALRR